MSSLRYKLVRCVRVPARVVLKDSVRYARRRIARRRSLSPARWRAPLAIHGGLPVRDVGLRPWPTLANDTSLWRRRAGAWLQRIFCHGPEGKPQPLARRFEQAWAEHCAVPHALLLPHGTDALRIALAAALDIDGLEHGGEVIVPNLSFIASSTACLDRRLGVALVDVEPTTLLLDPQRVEEAIEPGRTKAILAVHLFGQPADMRALREIAARHGLALIEDAAQAHGAVHALGPAGALGDAAAFSFQSSKNLSAGEGGALTTPDPTLFERAFAIHDAGRARNGGQRWAHDHLGWNVRPSEYTAAVLLARLENFALLQQRRTQNFERLRGAFDELRSVRPLDVHADVVRHGAHMFVLRYQPEHCGGLELSSYLDALRAEGIPAGTLYNGIPQSEQPVLRQLRARRPDYVRVAPTPVAAREAPRLLWLPHECLLGGEEEMHEIAAAFAKVESHYARGPVAVPAPAQDRPAAERSTQAAVSELEIRPARRVLRFGLVGCGAMGSLHAAAIARSVHARLAGVFDVSGARAAELAARSRTRQVEAREELFDTSQFDAIVVATPHSEHVAPVLSALRAGLHVVCEKPLAITACAADEMIAAARGSDGRFAVVLQNRLEPAYRTVHTLLQSGELGAIVRTSVEEVGWRHQGYFDARSWRGTWQGEGGGVLVNQAPHALDRYVWLAGLPRRVHGLTTTRLHAIEVEDTASALLEHEGGRQGTIHVSTAEGPPLSRTLIACERGRIVIEDLRVRIERLDEDLPVLARAGGERAPSVRTERTELECTTLAEIPRQLDAFYANFLGAVDGREELLCPGEEGILSLELANATALSAAEGRPVTLPVDRDRYRSFLARKQELPATMDPAPR